ncbi:MAG: nuclear transport factor 2 family protein [Alphaproteobacteria bacterium]
MTEDIFEDHLRLRQKGDLESDLQRNYADDIVLICSFGVIRGHDAIRESARRLGFQLPGAKFEFTTKQIVDEYALLEWEATSDNYSVKYGVDSFVIRNGKIVMQTIRYTLIQGDQTAG